MRKIFKKFIKFIYRNKWILVESKTGVWNLSHGEVGLVQKFLFYNIEYCFELDEYRLTTKGEQAEQHRMYGKMLTRLASYNLGIAEPDNDEKTISGLLTNKSEIRIVSIPLSQESDDVWQLVSENQALIDAINAHISVLKKEGVEIFEQRKNIVATDTGYFLAVWLKDINFKDTPPNEGNENQENNEE